MLKSFSAMILAAGYGKRMLSLTNEIPKPLVKVNNISLLKNSIDFLNVKNEIVSNGNNLNKYTHIILPGVGSFGSAIKKVKSNIPMDTLEKEVLITN